ncbi:ExbD/TolR family protein [Halomonas borealis]|uniref:ExbD/TolR family protein n=1 Tax=Halomonas borealis TaxID=2508710 RepID=UPI0010A0AD05|nr:biopolymer transporter ExbD [Halomonas borealis]
MRVPRRRREAVDINLTPLIDVVFLLLIFFMVSTTFETRRALELELPEGVAGGTAGASAVTVVVTPDDGYRLGGRRLTAGQLAVALSDAAPAAREHGLVIEADARATHADVVRVLDRAGALDIRRVRIATAEATHSEAETP